MMDIQIMLFDCMGVIVYGYLMLMSYRDGNREASLAWLFTLTWFLLYLCSEGRI